MEVKQRESLSTTQTSDYLLIIDNLRFVLKQKLFQSVS